MLMKPYYSYAQLAVLMELNSRECRRKREMFPEELRFFAMLAGSIVGAELAKHVPETPDAVVQQSASFAQHLAELAPPADDSVFSGILTTYLVETLKDELRFCCANCRRFDACAAIDTLAVGKLFRRRAEGEDTEEIRDEIQRQIGTALEKTPYLQVEIADELCPQFVHNYTASDIGGVISRYAAIAAALRDAYGIDYQQVQALLIEINMEFAGRCGI